MDEILKDLPMYTGIALGAYTALLVGVQAVQDLATEKITSQEQLDDVVEKEAEKLGMDPRLVIGEFHTVGDDKYNSLYGARSHKQDVEIDNQTVTLDIVEIKEGWGARRGAVRHELYHLDRHLPRKIKNPVGKFLRGFFYEEPTATLYATTGKKL